MPIGRNRARRKGAVLVGAFLVSMALVVSMMGLLSFSRTADQQARSLLSRNKLARMAQEKFTRDLLALNKNVDLKSFDTSPAHFQGGQAQSVVQALPAGFKDVPFGHYLVVVATVANVNAPSPRHLRLETILEFSQTAAAAPAHIGPGATPLPQYIRNQLLGFLSEDDPRFEEAMEAILAMLESELGPGLESIQVPASAAQYRDPHLTDTAPHSHGERGGDFYMSPVVVDRRKSPLRVRVWKETYY